MVYPVYVETVSLPARGKPGITLYGCSEVLSVVAEARAANAPGPSDSRAFGDDEPRLVLRHREGGQSGGKSATALPAPRRGPVARPPPKASRASPRTSQRGQDQTRIGAKVLGAPERIRTSGLWLRRPTLYPPELQAHVRKSTGLRDASQPQARALCPEMCPSASKRRPGGQPGSRYGTGRTRRGSGGP